jgi:hypothetical protein
MSLARLEDQVLFAADRRTYTLGPDGVLTPGTDLPGRAGEVRAWPTRRGWAVGACLPEQSQILWGGLPPGWAPDWAASLVTAVGPTLDRLGDPLVYPVSFDAGPDGRLFVVDAGHGRIVVFNTARRYVTQWGEPGSGEGQFNFGLGASLVSGDRDYSGSVAVDTQGRIYVADGFNGRIQIFVP